MINKSIDELESELDYLGRPIAVDAGVSKVNLPLLYFVYPASVKIEVLCFRHNFTLFWNFVVPLTKCSKSIWMEGK